MKTTTMTALFACIALSVSAGEVLTENGDFEKGKRKWKGDVEVEFETPDEKNQVCMMEVEERDDTEFHQELDVDDYLDLTLKFRIKKSEDYKGRGYQVRFIRDDESYTYMTRKLPKKSDQWEDMEIKFSDINESNSIELRFIVRSGEAGYLAFDDIEVVGE